MTTVTFGRSWATAAGAHNSVTAARRELATRMDILLNGL